MSNNFNNIAVLIDADNVSSKYINFIFEKIALSGEISVRRIYGDWTSDNMRSWKYNLQEFAIQPIQQFNNVSGKNSTDSALIIDAMDLLYKEYFDCFCLVSSDSDFTRLAQRIREQGKYVIGIGEHKTPVSFVNGCNEFIYLQNNASKENEIKQEKNKQITIEKIIENALDSLADTSGWVHLSKLMAYIRKVKPDFEIKELKVKKALDYFIKKGDKFLVKKESEDGPCSVFISIRR